MNKCSRCGCCPCRCCDNGMGDICRGVNCIVSGLGKGLCCGVNVLSNLGCALINPCPPKCCCKPCCRPCPHPPACRCRCVCRCERVCD